MYLYKNTTYFCSRRYNNMHTYCDILCMFSVVFVEFYRFFSSFSPCYFSLQYFFFICETRQFIDPVLNLITSHNVQMKNNNLPGLSMTVYVL